MPRRGSCWPERRERPWTRSRRARAGPRPTLCNPTVGRCGNPGSRRCADPGRQHHDRRWSVAVPVAALEDIDHPVSVARAVMEKTPHVMLVGAGAQQFAIEQGFRKTPLLTETARQAWMQWRETSALRTADQCRTHHPPRRRAPGRQPQPRHPRHPRDGRARPACRCLHHQWHGLEAARPGQRQPDHRRRPVCGPRKLARPRPLAWAKK